MNSIYLPQPSSILITILALFTVFIWAKRVRVPLLLAPFALSDDLNSSISSPLQPHHHMPLGYLSHVLQPWLNICLLRVLTPS